MRRIAILSGYYPMPRYTNHLKNHYQKHGYIPTVYSFPTSKIAISRLHWLLNSYVEKITNENDIFHCISGSNYLILPHFYKNNIIKPVITESTGIVIHHQTFLAAINVIKNYKEPVSIPTKYITNFMMNILFCEPKLKDYYLLSLHELVRKRISFQIHSLEDTVVDIEKMEYLFNHGKLYNNGKHGRIFLHENNDFQDIINIINSWDGNRFTF